MRGSTTASCADPIQMIERLGSTVATARTSMASQSDVRPIAVALEAAMSRSAWTSPPWASLSGERPRTIDQQVFTGSRQDHHEVSSASVSSAPRPGTRRRREGRDEKRQSRQLPLAEPVVHLRRQLAVARGWRLRRADRFEPLLGRSSSRAMPSHAVIAPVPSRIGAAWICDQRSCLCRTDDLRAPPPLGSRSTHVAAALRGSRDDPGRMRFVMPCALSCADRLDLEHGEPGGVHPMTVSSLAITPTPSGSVSMIARR